MVGEHIYQFNVKSLFSMKNGEENGFFYGEKWLFNTIYQKNEKTKSYVTKTKDIIDMHLWLRHSFLNEQFNLNVLSFFHLKARSYTKVTGIVAKTQNWMQLRLIFFVYWNRFSILSIFRYRHWHYWEYINSY